MLIDGVMIFYTGIMVYRENKDAVRIWRSSIYCINNDNKCASYSTLLHTLEL